MRGGELTRVEFKELAEAAKGGVVQDIAEFDIVKTKIFDPLSGVSFTPQKKVRYSDDSWEYPDVEMLPTISEGPDTGNEDEMASHIKTQWKGVVQAVEALKTMAAKNTKYETEIDNL